MEEDEQDIYDRSIVQNKVIEERDDYVQDQNDRLNEDEEDEE
jgi:hypothetical protein